MAILKVLLLEDSDNDAQLLLLHLKKGGYETDLKRVETADAMIEALKQQWDIIISDYSMPQFSAPQALEILNKNNIEIPFIIISGTIGEETAVNSLLAGAHDFLLKNRLSRLIPAIERELRESRDRKLSRETEEKAKEKAKRYNDRLEFLHKIDQAILTAQTAELVCKQTLEFIIPHMSVIMANIVLFDFIKNEGQFFIQETIGDQGSSQKVFQLNEWSQQDIKKFSTSGVQIIRKVEILPIYLSGLKNNSSHAYVSIPLINQDKLIGSLNLVIEEESTFSEESSQIASEIANQLAIAIQQFLLREQIKLHTEELEKRVQERTSELQEQRTFLRSVIDVSPSMIFVKDYNSKFVLANSRVAEIYGTTVENLIGKSDVDFNPSKSEIADFLKADRKVIDTGKTLVVEEPVTHASGQISWFQTVKVPIISTDGNSKYVLGVSTNITERKQLEKSLLEAFQKEKEINELKSRFTSMVSHEFRTPLTVILSASNLLESYYERFNEEKREKYFKQISFQVNQLVGMLNDILLLGQLDITDIKKSAEEVKLDMLCNTTITSIQLTTNIHDIQLSVTGTPRVVMLDKKLMQGVISNLLSNAVKYSPKGGIIKVELIYKEKQVILRVIDNGIGIPDSDKKRLFDNFHRASNVGSISGTGLGLSIAKRSVEAHNGTIEFNSDVDKGTTFTIIMPV